ncbi:spore germination protein [Desulfofundulus thermobenzoicus]|uniref:Spore germination protein n=1 Tax=Desulfofundulus thermobenzoicus TaxID=29376 RepID=A0A6N7IS61_9FIRM|nr:spore germination protein [Desulfofundulus thermobenzoicus]MQL52975.1 spore germination protein [Desulfofundulus thermobenzoicus]
MAETLQKDRQNKTPLSKDLEENTRWLKKKLGVGESYDIILREMNIGGVKAALLFVDGLTNDQIFTRILDHMADLEREGMTINTFRKLFYRHVPYTEVSQADNLEDVVEKVLSGPQALLIDGEEKAIIIDARIYPVRQPEEPDLERVVRGSRDGFTETLVFNTALIRRRVRDPRLRMEILQAGTRSKTDIVICFLQDVANADLVDSIKEKIKHIEIDGLPMAEKAVEELITPGSYWNPFPRVRYTERPDVAAMHLLEGHVLVLVDTSPSVMIAPATYFHHLQHAEEYRQSPAVGVWLRAVRFVGVAISIFLLPLWLLAAMHPELLPPALSFIGPKKIGAIPLIIQFIIAEFAVDMVRLATIHTPTSLSTAISLIAALLIGDIAISVGLFAPEVILYTTVAALGTFLTPSYELSLANRLVRLFLLAAVALLGLPGFIIGLLATLAILVATRSFGVPYMWPLIPFNWNAMKKVLVRSPVPIDNIRPSILHPRDKYRQSAPEPARKRRE